MPIDVDRGFVYEIFWTPTPPRPVWGPPDRPVAYVVSPRLGTPTEELVRRVIRRLAEDYNQPESAFEPNTTLRREFLRSYPFLGLPGPDRAEMLRAVRAGATWWWVRP